jgi:two-component system sensor histidine kinase YesM
MKQLASPLPLRILVLIILVAVILPASGAILLTYQRAAARVVKQEEQTYREILRLKQQEIDSRLDTAEIFLRNIVSTNDQDFAITLHTTDWNRYMLAKIALYSLVSRYRSMLGNMDFCYFRSLRFEDDMILAINANTWDGLRRHLAAVPARYREQPNLSAGWYVEYIEGKPYFLRSYASAPVELIMGVSLEHLLPPAEDHAALGEGGFFFFTGAGGEALAQSGAGGLDGAGTAPSTRSNRVVLESRGAGGLYRIGMSITRRQLYSGFPAAASFGMTAITVILLLILALTFVLLRRFVLRPLSQAVSAMGRAGAGNLEARLPDSAASQEFTLLNRSFNRMLEEISTLQVNVYQERILRQRADLEQLKLQLNPHFLLNSLNMIYTFIRRGRTEGAMEFIRCLITYFRLTLRNKDAFTTLGAEIDFIRNYIRLWELQYPNTISLEVTLPPYMENYRIPQLTLQTLAENSIKHNYSAESLLRIDIRFFLEEDESGRARFCGVYADNGAGFPADFLRTVNDPPGEDARPAHIGIYNLKKRMDLLYHGKSRVIFSNLETGGARAAFTFFLEDAEDESGSIGGGG